MEEEIIKLLCWSYKKGYEDAMNILKETIPDEGDLKNKIEDLFRKKDLTIN